MAWSPEHDAINVILQMIAEEIVIRAVLQEYAPRAIMDIIPREIIPLGRVEKYAHGSISTERILCNRIVVRPMCQWRSKCVQ